MNPSRDKNAKARTLVGRGEKSLLSDLGSELRLRGSRTRRAKIINGMGWEKKVRTGTLWEAAHQDDINHA